MSITSPDARISSYSPVVPTTDFPALFPVFDNDDLIVVHNGVERTDFAVSSTYSEGISNNAKAVFAVGITGDVKVVGGRAPHRTSRFSNGGPLPIRDQNLAFDTMEAELQEARRDLSRSVLAPYGEEGYSIEPGTIGQALIYGDDHRLVPFNLVPGVFPETVAVATISALQAVLPYAERVAILTQSGRGGTFVWKEGDFTTRVATDPLNALYVPSLFNPSGSLGCWVRQGSWAVTGVELGWTGGVPGTDCSDAIEAAAAFGFSVLMFNGDAFVSRQINLAKSVNFVRQPSIGVSRIVVNHATADIFNITAAGVTFEGIQIVSVVTRTAGAYFKLTNANFCRFEKMYIDGQYQAFWLSGSTGVYIQDNVFGGGTPASVAVGGCMVKLTGDVNVDCRFKGNLGIAVALANMPSYGIWAQHTDAMQINDCDIIRRGICLYLNPQSGQSVAATKVSISYFDNAAEGVRFEPAAGGSISRAVFEGCWSASHTGGAWRFTGGGSIGSVSLNGCEGLLSAHGIIQEISSDLQVNGGVYSQNANGGFTALNGIGNFSLNGAVFGAQTGLTGNSTGINLIGATHDNYRIIGCDLRGNISATFTNGGPDPAGGTRIFRDNLGYITTTKGEATVPVGQAVVTVNHGLPFTPYSSDITLTATGSLTASGVANFYVTAITTTTFQIACNAVVSGVGLKVGWFIHGR